MREKFAVQLYTLRDQLQEDFRGVLKQLGQMGWAGVELAGLHGYPAEQIADWLQACNLEVAGMHVDIARLEKELEDVLAEARLFQTRDIICPYLIESIRHEAGYKKVRQTLNDIAEKVAPEGFRISYHNHDFEFKTTIAGTSALEYLLASTADNAVLAEIDVYWVKKSGRDPLTFIEPYAWRMPLVHLKDMTADARETFAAVGSGCIDFAPILNWCEQNGVEWYVVEQDVCPGNPLHSIEASLRHLQQLASYI